MSYFKNFPYIVWKPYMTDKTVMTDIMTRIYYRSGFDNEKALYTFYDIQEGERIEDVSLKIYGSQDYHWIILLFNEILNPYTEWYLTESQIIELSESKYSDIYDIHHHESGGFINSVGTGTPISNLQYEINENDKRRRIKILKTEYLNFFLEEFSKLV